MTLLQTNWVEFALVDRWRTKSGRWILHRKYPIQRHFFIFWENRFHFHIYTQKRKSKVWDRSEVNSLLNLYQETTSTQKRARNKTLCEEVSCVWMTTYDVLSETPTEKPSFGNLCCLSWCYLVFPLCIPFRERWPAQSGILPSWSLSLPPCLAASFQAYRSQSWKFLTC